MFNNDRKLISRCPLKPPRPYREIVTAVNCVVDPDLERTVQKLVQSVDRARRRLEQSDDIRRVRSVETQHRDEEHE